MASITGKSPGQFYKDLFHVANNNAGVDVTTRRIFDGAGNTVSILLSSNVLGVQPDSFDGTGTFYVKKDNGNSVFNVDTLNSLVKTGTEQANATTSYKYFSSLVLSLLLEITWFCFQTPLAIMVQ